MFKPVHIHRNRLNQDVNSLLMLIPTVVFILVLAFVFANSQKNLKKEQEATLSESTSTFSSREIKIGDRLMFVEVADTQEARVKGLSGRNSLGENRGMLFLFDQKDVNPPFWMKDMSFAIDIIWINDGKIAQVDKEVPPPEALTPDSELKLYLPNQPIDYVLEVEAGFVDENNLKVGDGVDLSNI